MLGKLRSEMLCEILRKLPCDILCDLLRTILCKLLCGLNLLCEPIFCLVTFFT